MYYFTESPSDRSLESLMKTPPNFQPKGGGIYHGSRFRFTPEMCSCRFCIANTGSGYRASPCLCLQERIETGIAPWDEVVLETFKEAGNRQFKERLINAMSNFSLCFDFNKISPHRHLAFYT